MIRWIPRSLRVRLRGLGEYRSPVLWANFGQLSRLLARLLPTRSPSLLVLSIPRSGSSWVGDILGLSNGALYLREPLTQTYLTSKGRNVPSFFEVMAESLPPTYKESADAAFAGMPFFPSAIVKYPGQWALSERSGKLPVIKEVNPLATKWIMEAYRPRVVYLIRHPAAVANSFSKLGWIGKQFEGRFSAETLASSYFELEQLKTSFWAEFGALQAIVLRSSLETLRGYGGVRIVKYEDLCISPLETYRGLYDFAGLDWNSCVEEQVVRHSDNLQSVTTGQKGVYRKSEVMINRWKAEVREEAVRQLKEGYLSFDPAYYGSEEW